MLFKWNIPKNDAGEIEMVKQYGLYIDGKQVATKEQLDVLDKYSQEAIATVSVAGLAQVDQAVEAARNAYKKIQLSPYRRFEILKRVGELLLEYKEAFAEIITQEAGKPWKQAMNEVDRSAQTFEIAAEEAKRIHGEGVPVEAAPGSENRMAFTLRVPVGVVGAISPFNFPLNLVSHKVAPAIAAGNAVVLKPASTTPIAALKLAEVFEEAGLPAGLFNVVIGPGSTVGDRLMKDERIDLYTFTGSAAVGLKLKQNTGLKKLTLELGNNSPVIVDKEANIELAAKNIAQKSFAYAGQVCISVQRIYVHESIVVQFQKLFLDEVKKLHVGNPLDPITDVGPMISVKEAERAETWISEAIEQGAEVIQGGQRDGAVLQPTVLAGVKKDMKVVCEEIFAPVVSMLTYNNLDDCIEEVNESAYGLQGGIFTRNLDTAFHVARKVEVGGMMLLSTV